MAEGILGLGSGGAAALNQELIDKLKEAERTARVSPIETEIENIIGESGESAKIAEIKLKINELLETIKPFDLFVSGGITAFDQKTANVTGTSAVFDAVDVSAINQGTTTVFIEQLAKRDVFQTNSFSDAEGTIPTSSSIELNGESFTTQGEDFAALAAAINASTNFTASYDSGTGDLTINDGVNGDKVFSTTSKTYADIASDIQAEGTISSTIPAKPASGDIITLSQPGRPVYQSDIIVAADDIVDASGGTITINGKDFTVTATMKYSELVDLINADDDFNAKLTISGRLEITHSDKETALSITESLNSNSIGLSLGEKYSTEGKTYKSLAASINSNSNYNATIETVGNGVSRLVIKSSETGLENAISITQTGVDLGLNEPSNHTVTAQNLKATVDGIDYDVSSNVLIVDGGLKITAVEENNPGEFSTISVQKDSTTIEPMLQNFVTKYNELISLIDNELFSAQSNIEDKSTLRSMVENIKGQLFDSYGTNDSLNVFNFGFEIDKSGVLSLDSNKFNEALENNSDDLRSLFIGVAENRGLGTNLKEYVDALDGFKGLLTTYEANMNERKDSLEKEKEKAIENLDNRYALLSQQFAAYGAIINQFEAQFSGLKLMIEQSIASN